MEQGTRLRIPTPCFSFDLTYISLWAAGDMSQKLASCDILDVEDLMQGVFAPEQPPNHVHFHVRHLPELCSQNPSFRSKNLDYRSKTSISAKCDSIFTYTINSTVQRCHLDPFFTNASPNAPLSEDTFEAYVLEGGQDSHSV